jgi:hypothetical protein
MGGERRLAPGVVLIYVRDGSTNCFDKIRIARNYSLTTLLRLATVEVS